MTADDKKTAPDKPFLTTKEAAAWLGCTRTHSRNGAFTVGAQSTASMGVTSVITSKT